MNDRVYDEIAWLIHREIKPLRPLERKTDVDPFNSLRLVSAKLAVVFIETDPTFDSERFIALAMTGKAS